MKTLKSIFVFLGLLTFSGAEVRFLVNPSRMDGVLELKKNINVFYSSLLEEDYYGASQLVYGYSGSDDGESYYFIHGFDYTKDLLDVCIVEMIAFESDNKEVSGVLAIVRYSYSSSRGAEVERFSTDAWFVSDGKWTVSPGKIALVDRSFDPIPVSFASSLFLSVEDFQTRIEDLRQNRGSARIPKEEEIFLIEKSRRDLQLGGGAEK